MHFVYLRVLETLWLLFVYSILIQPRGSATELGVQNFGVQNLTVY